MTFVRILAALMFVAITLYTLVTGFTYGWNLFSIFFSDLFAMTWPGQFNFDFSGFLILSATWVLWRHEFSVLGWILSPMALVGGIMFLSAYLFVTTTREATSLPELLLGKKRAERHRNGPLEPSASAHQDQA